MCKYCFSKIGKVSYIYKISIITSVFCISKYIPTGKYEHMTNLLYVYTGVFLFIRDKNTIINLYQPFCMFILVFFIRDKNTHFAIKIKKMTLQIHLKFNSNKSACHTDSFMQSEYE